MSKHSRGTFFGAPSELRNTCAGAGVHVSAWVCVCMSVRVCVSGVPMSMIGDGMEFYSRNDLLLDSDRFIRLSV